MKYIISHLQTAESWLGLNRLFWKAAPRTKTTLPFLRMARVTQPVFEMSRYFQRLETNYEL